MAAALLSQCSLLYYKTHNYDIWKEMVAFDIVYKKSFLGTMSFLN